MICKAHNLIGQISYAKLYAVSISTNQVRDFVIILTHYSWPLGVVFLERLLESMCVYVTTGHIYNCHFASPLPLMTWHDSVREAFIPGCEERKVPHTESDHTSNWEAEDNKSSERAR